MRKLLFVAPLLFAAACTSSQGDDDSNGSTDGNVQLSISDANGAVVGAKVAFVNPDGTVAADTTTDADGVARATIEPGASVTANVNGLTTVLGLQPGDSATIAPTTDVAPATKGQFAASFSDDSGATSYSVDAACAAASGKTSPLSISVPNPNDCAIGAFLATATDANGALVGYSLDPAVGVAKDGTYAFSGAWKQPDSFAVNVAGIDPKLVGGIKAELGTEVNFATDTESVPATAASGTATLRAVLALRNGFDLFVDDVGGTHHQTLLQPVGASDQDVSVDLSKDLLAWITGVTYDAGSATVAVATDGGDPGGLLEVDLAYGKQAWHVFGPTGDSLSVHLPKLPTTWASFEPQSTDTVTPSAQLIAVDAEAYATLHLLAPWAAFHYAGHPQSATRQLIRISN